MKRLLVLALLVSVLSTAAFAYAATEVKMTGDVRIHANWFPKQNYTGWTGDGTQTADSFTIWERFRLRTDFMANEDLKFRLGIRVNDAAWGHGTMTVDNPAVSIDVYQAFLQFKWPGTDVEFTIGKQPFTVAHSSFFAGSSIILDTEVAAAVVNIPVVKDGFAIQGAFLRLLDSNKDFDTTTQQVPDEFDAYYLSLPITVEGFSATPWAMLAVAGRAADYAGTEVGGAGSYNSTLATNLFSAGQFALDPASSRNGQNVFWWAGGAFEVTALDPLKFFADVIYGEGNGADRAKNRRKGLFVDLAAEYTGFDALTPQVAFWWSTGEDDSLRNGSERLPQLVPAWGTSTSMLFDSDQAFVSNSMGVNAVGSWGFSASLNKVSFMKDLTHRLTAAYAHGTNSSRALRTANEILGVGGFYQMGRDLTVNEYVIGVNLDNTYAIYDNLALMANFGWSHGEFERSVWGRRFVNQANSGDAFLAVLGLQYKF
ncbi:MAG: outer membrane homotrimeric porin [Desulfovibrio sp.]|nr:outer membrane homotrimeric porin [Desulfovibrio sp.]MBI4957991.1 outer membrane homotrimeric porin [Desulfovibrio sp.]